MESKIKSMKHITFDDNVSWFMQKPPMDFVESLKFIERSGTFFEALSAFRSKPRKNQKNLSSDDKNNFNSAIESAIRDDQYQKIADIHADMTHLMHSMGGPVGTLRFLSWHRVYLYKMEVLLGVYATDIRIPYWDWANDHELPTWVYKPSGVSRGPVTSIKLPSPPDVSETMKKSTYLEFTNSLEGLHNTVHRWAGGTMDNLMYSPKDPIFWLHHANVDRIWLLWKHTHKEKPPLVGPAATMDPWPDTIDDANLVQHYFYYYK